MGLVISCDSGNLAELDQHFEPKRIELELVDLPSDIIWFLLTVEKTLLLEVFLYYHFERREEMEE